MKKHRKLNLNKVRIVSLKNMHNVRGGDTTFGLDTAENCATDTTTSNSTGTGDPGQYQATSNTFSSAPDPLLSGTETNCNMDDTLPG